MPVTFLSPQQRERYGQFCGDPTPEQLARYFHLDDADLAFVGTHRGTHMRLGCAIQLGTLRFLGTLLADPVAVPAAVVRCVAEQLGMEVGDGLGAYRASRWRWRHPLEIRHHYGYRDIGDGCVGFRLGRWLFALCWTGTERPGVLFDRASDWLLTHKVLLPGASVLERFVDRLRSRAEARLWRLLGCHIDADRQARLEALLTVPQGGRYSPLDRLRTGPVSVSSQSLTAALRRLQAVRALGITLPAATVPPSRLASLARFAGAAKVSAITRLPPARRLATLVAFVHCLEATAQDDALEVLEQLLRGLFADAARADRQARLRTLKDLDRAALLLATVGRLLLDPEVVDTDLRTQAFARVPPETLAQALASVEALTRPPDDVFYGELEKRYTTAPLPADIPQGDPLRRQPGRSTGGGGLRLVARARPPPQSRRRAAGGDRQVLAAPGAG